MDKQIHNIRIAIVLYEISEQWQRNILQVLGRTTVASVNVDGLGAIAAPAIHLSKEQARHLATQITEILGPESERYGGVV
jgi:hypothetical protein